MYLYWGEAWVWSLCHQAQIGGVSQWCLSFCKFLPSLYKIMELNQSDHQCLDHLSNQDPSPSIAQFVQEARSRKSTDCFKLNPLRIMEAKCSFNIEFFFVVFPRSVVWTQSCLTALQAIPLTSWLIFCSDIHFSCYTLYRQVCVPFQIMSNQLNLPQVNSSRSIKTSQRRSSETGMLLI